MSSIRIDGIKHERWDTTPAEQQLGVLAALDTKIERLQGDRDHLLAIVRPVGHFPKSSSLSLNYIDLAGALVDVGDPGGALAGGESLPGHVRVGSHEAQLARLVRQSR